MRTSKVGVVFFVLCFLGGYVCAGIVAEVSCRTEGGTRADENRTDGSKLSVRASSNGGKSWIKFNIGALDVGSLETATLIVSLHEGKDGSQRFDVSYVNDDYRVNQDWTEGNITWNNAPGNDPASLGLLDPTKTTFLTTVEFTDGFAGDSFDIDVLAALQNDTDGIVQFVLHNSPNLLNFSTHDHDIEAQQPVINFTERPRGARNPIPAHRANTLPTSLSALSWTNPDPNIPGTAIVCDVYFGLDPNRLQMDKVTLDADAASVDLSAANFPSFVPLMNRTTYYWIVDCYDPSLGAPPADLIPGSTWNFYTNNNDAPFADAGPDQVAWLGMGGTPGQEVILLEGITSDDGLPNPPGAYTVQWTQVANGAPSVTISPDNTETTSVTITARGTYEFMLTADDSEWQTSDTVQIIVGDTPCDASHMSTGTPYNAADQNRDCIVDLEDFVALIVVNWLNCTDVLTHCGN
ncbi:MAG: DNRLRE domain-containing protein [Sedimentisphaerales bacterium]|nr:DNRLRE domain-containing protein [Sedimentisphaerales bacterium]